MKYWLILLALTLGTGTTALSKSNRNKQELSTNMNFEGLTVDGKYRTASEAVATVEDEKLLNDLLGVRKNFKDRIKKSALRH